MGIEYEVSALVETPGFLSLVETQGKGIGRIIKLGSSWHIAVAVRCSWKVENEISFVISLASNDLYGIGL